MVLASGSPGRGEEFRVSADATLQEEYQDNVLFAPTAEESSWLTTLAPEVRLRFGEENTGATASARLEGRVYSADHNLNTVNQLYTAAVERRHDRTTAGVSAGLVLDTTLDSELQQTGIVLGSDSRSSGVVGADVGYALSELTQTTWRYRHTDVRYTAPALVDYVDHGVQWDTRRALSEMERSIGTSIKAMVFDADTGYRSQEWSATGSYVHPFNERDRASLTAGIRWTRVETEVPLDAVSTDTGLVGEASLTRRWETADVSAAVSQWTNPSGSGRLLTTTRLALHGAYALTDRATATLRFDWYRNTDVVSFGGSSDSTFVRVEPGLSWRIGERVTAAAAYTHERQRLSIDRIDANRVMARLTYQWHRSE